MSFTGITSSLELEGKGIYNYNALKEILSFNSINKKKCYFYKHLYWPFKSIK